jgi:hypothetical protein
LQQQKALEKTGCFFEGDEVESLSLYITLAPSMKCQNKDSTSDFTHSFTASGHHDIQAY